MKEIKILVPPAAMLKDGVLETAKMKRYFLWMADHGINGLFLNGSTGEFNILTFNQRSRRYALPGKRFRTEYA